MLFDALFKHRNRTSCDQKKSCIKSLTNSTANATNARVFIMLLVVWIFSALPCCAPDEDADKADVSMKRPLWRAKWEQEHPWKPSRMAKKRAWRRKQAAKHAPEPQLPGLGRPKTYSERLVDRLVAAPVKMKYFSCNGWCYANRNTIYLDIELFRTFLINYYASF
jgi:hypothetical protein